MICLNNPAQLDLISLELALILILALGGFYLKWKQLKKSKVI